MFTSTLVAPRTASGQTVTVTGVGPWTQQNNYGSSSQSGGIQILGQSCVIYTSFEYCVGGQNLGSATGTDLSDVFYAAISSSGTLGAWTETTDYGASSGTSGSGGTGIEWPSCVEYDGYLYCVGGATNGGLVSKVFYAQLSSSGVGPWTETTDYGAASGDSGTGGITGFQRACVTDSGYVYCVGDAYGTSQVFYAQLSSSGVGPWKETTDYGATTGDTGAGGLKIASTACVDSSGYIYCVGGTISFKPVSDVFYAQLTSSGVGAWTETTDYGAAGGSSGSGGVPIYGTTCAEYATNILCVDGDTTGNTGTNGVYFAQDPGLLKWLANLTPFPEEAYWILCVIYYGPEYAIMYCNGGGDQGYSAPIEPTSGGTTETSTIVEATPSITTKLSTISIEAGGSVTDTATLSDVDQPAGGSVLYTVYTGSSCTGTPLATLGDMTVVNGVVPPSDPTGAIITPGTYCFKASYSGDPNNEPAVSGPEILTVTPATSTSSSSTTSTTTTTTSTTTPVTSQTSNNDLIWIGIGVAVVVLGGGGFLFWTRGRKGTPPDDSGPPPPPPTVIPPTQPTTPEQPDVPCCGPDITDNVLAGMLKLMQDFFSWSSATQSEQFGYLTAVTGDPNYNNAWDIEELAPSGGRSSVWEFRPPPVTYQTAKDGYMKTLAPYAGRCMKPPYPCDPSVMFLKNCHHPQVVNYVEWGVLARLKEWYDENEAHKMKVQDTSTGIANDAAATSSTYTPVTSYGDSTYADFHKARSGSVPGLTDPNYQDQVAMANVGWRLAEDYITRMKSGGFMSSYKLSQVNQLALEAILEMYEDKSRQTAKCKEGCGKYNPPNAFRYIFGDKRPLRAGSVSEY